MWIVAIAGAVVAALLVTKLGRFLRVGGRVLVLLTVAVGGLLWYRNRGEAAGRARIPAASVELTDLKLTPREGGGGRFTLAAHVRNKSPSFTLSEIRVGLLLRDCAKSGGCDLKAVHTERIAVTIPPGESREVRDDIDVWPAPVTRGRLAVAHVIVSTAGR